MQHLKAITASVLVSVCHSLALANGVRLLETVRGNIQKAENCLGLSLFEEAQAYAEVTLMPRAVRYAALNDIAGTADRAVAIWQASLGREIEFVKVPYGQADLRIVYVGHTAFYGRDVMGKAVTRRYVLKWSSGDYRYQVTGSLEVSTKLPHGVPASEGAVLNTTLHEIGHFLGLDDSSRPSDVMGPIQPNSPTTLPSIEEVDALMALRELAGTVLARAKDQDGLAETVRD